MKVSRKLDEYSRDFKHASATLKAFQVGVRGALLNLTKDFAVKDSDVGVDVGFHDLALEISLEQHHGNQFTVFIGDENVPATIQLAGDVMINNDNINFNYDDFVFSFVIPKLETLLN